MIYFIIHPMIKTPHESLPDFQDGESLITTEHFEVSAYLRSDAHDLASDVADFTGEEDDTEIHGFLQGIYGSREVDSYVNELTQKLRITGSTDLAKAILRAVAEKRHLDPSADIYGEVEEWEGKDPSALYLPYDSSNFTNLNAGIQPSTHARIAEANPRLARADLEKQSRANILFGTHQTLPSLLELEHLLSAFKDTPTDSNVDLVLDQMRERLRELTSLEN